MRDYELMVILDPEIDERTVAPSLDRFLKVVTDAGGTIAKVDIWGKRRMAYDIKKRSEGIYAVVNLSATPDVAKELDRQLNLAEVVLRTKLLRPEPVSARRAKAAAAQSSAAAAAASATPAPAAPRTPSAPRPAAAPRVPAAPKAPSATPKAPAPRPASR
ncbi:MAG: 30S ribosomal protein S6 [Actinomycetales bacterium]|nr:30S ribosomal protein S6 [Actinomycetales bacterium]